MRALKRTFIEGAMVVLPIGAMALLVLGIIHRLQDAASPITGRYLHPVVVACILLVLLILLVGWMVRWGPVRQARLALEARLFDKIPGYRLVKAYAAEGPLLEGRASTMRPAMVSIEEGLCPALVMEAFSDGRLLVFVPGSPAPMSGAIYVFTPDRVTFLDVPLLVFLRAISSWGIGLREMIEGQAALRPAGAPPP